MDQTGRRRFLIATGSVLAAAPLGVHAQSAGRVARVGLLSNTPPPNREVAPVYSALREGLSAHGWVEGRNLVIEERYAEGRAERYPVLAAELVAAGVDAIVAAGTLGTEAARNATRKVPIVMVGVPNPVGQGYVASLARPGGNITGVASMLHLIPLKSLELLLEIVPRAKRIGLLWSPTDSMSSSTFKTEQARADELGVREISLPAAAPEDIDPALELAQRERIEALRVHPTGVFAQDIRKIAAWATRHRLASVGGPRAFVQAGLLASYNPDWLHLWRAAGEYVASILRGGNPAEMPIQQPTTFLLVINIRAAKTMGIAVPQSVLTRADEVIE